MSTDKIGAGAKVERARPEVTLGRIDEALAKNARVVAEAERPLSGTAYMEIVYANRQQIATRAAERQAAREASRARVMRAARGNAN